ncbi:MAG TPA: hypothetical protein PKA58_04305, partial [Polyangium sp.]|nr:hypothetical protein [Polyangium sp.]
CSNEAPKNEAQRLPETPKSASVQPTTNPTPTQTAAPQVPSVAPPATVPVEEPAPSPSRPRGTPAPPYGVAPPKDHPRKRLSDSEL